MHRHRPGILEVHIAVMHTAITKAAAAAAAAVSTSVVAVARGVRSSLAQDLRGGGGCLIMAAVFSSIHYFCFLDIFL